MNISTIEPATGGTLTAGLQAALGVHPWAVAISTLGWAVYPRVHHQEIAGPGAEISVTWYIGKRSEESTRAFAAAAGARVRATGQASAMNLLGRLQTHARDPLRTADPQHPLLAALTGLENLATLRRWSRQGGPAPSPYLHGAHLLLRQEPFWQGQAPVPWTQGAEPVECVASIPLAAALVTAGFVYHPQPQPHPDQQGIIGLGFMDSPFRPGLLAACLAQGRAALEAFAERKPWGKILSLPLLPHDLTAPGPGPIPEHPFQTALGACLNAPRMVEAAKSAGQNPIRVLQKPGRRHRALVTDSILRAKTPKDQKVVQHLQKHLQT